MSAIAAAILELDAGGDVLRRLADDLRRVAPLLDKLHPGQTGPASAQRSSRTAASPTPIAPCATPASNARPPKPTPQSPARAKARGHLDKVLSALRDSGRPMKTLEIVSRTKLTAYAVKGALAELVKGGRVVHAGVTASSRWSLRQPAGRLVNGTEFETVWSGRKGDPSLCGDRAQRTT